MEQRKVSTDRRSKPTLMRTTLCPVRVVYELFREICYLFRVHFERTYDQEYKILACFSGSSRSSMVWDLEAFSPKPTDDSFAALSVRTAVYTNYLNQGFLSY